MGPDDQLNRLLQRGDDGAYFVDYLFNALHECLWMDEHRDVQLRASQHRDFVLERILRDLPKAPERVKQKLMWLGLYHNAVLRRLATDGTTKHNAYRVAELSISDAELHF